MLGFYFLMKDNHYHRIIEKACAGKLTEPDDLEFMAQVKEKEEETKKEQQAEAEKAKEETKEAGQDA